MNRLPSTLCRAAAAALATLLGACGGSDGNQPPTGHIETPLEEARYVREVNVGGQAVALAARVADPDGDGVTARWRAVFLDDRGQPTGATLELGTGPSLGWDLGVDAQGRLYDQALCQRPQGQRVRVELHASDTRGAQAEPYADARVVEVVCRPG